MYYDLCIAWKMESTIHPPVLHLLKNWLNHKSFNWKKKRNNFFFLPSTSILFSTKPSKGWGLQSHLFSDKILISEIITVLWDLRVRILVYNTPKPNQFCIVRRAKRLQIGWYLMMTRNSQLREFFYTSPQISDMHTFWTLVCHPVSPPPCQEG